jgi:hypothetical protein
MYGCLFGCVCREKCKYLLLLLDCILLSEFHDDLLTREKENWNLNFK